MNPLSDWLNTLSRKYNLGPLAPDETGLCVLRYGDEFELMIEHPSGADALRVQIPLTPVPESQREAFFRWLLTLNHRGEATRGAALSLNDASETVMLSALTPLNQLDALGFEQLIGNLIDCAESLRALLAQPIATGASAGEAREAIDPTHTATLQASDAPPFPTTLLDTRQRG